MKHGRKHSYEIDANESEIGAPPKNSSHTPSQPGKTPCGNHGPLSKEPRPAGSMWEYNETPSGGGKSKGGIEGNKPLL